MIKLNFSGDEIIKKKKEVLARSNSLQEDFKKREERGKKDLGKTARIWEETGKKFKWRGSLP